MVCWLSEDNFAIQRSPPGVLSHESAAAAMSSFFQGFDAFQRSKAEVQVRTQFGASISLIAGAVMVILFFSELVYWRTIRKVDHIMVDKSLGERNVDISLDIHFHQLPCSGASGFICSACRSPPPPPRAAAPHPLPPLSPPPPLPDVHLISEDNKGTPYDESSTRVELRDTSPGCAVRGTVRVKGLPGHLHVAAQRTVANIDGRLMYAVEPGAAAAFNASHTIRRFSFGPPFPGQVSPLDGTSSAPTARSAGFQHHLRVVPTVYEHLGGRVTDSRQYSASDFVQEYDAHAAPYVHPGLWLRYDFSPTMVRRVEVRRTFLQFVTSLCAILGGVFALSGVVDQVAHRVLETAQDK